MKVRKRTSGGRLWAFALALLFSLLVFPATALAATYPAADKVFVNGDVPFSSTDLYYTNYAYEAGTLAENPSWNAHYDPSTGTLELRGYQGDSIISKASAGQLTIMLSGADSIVSAYSDFAIINYGGSVLINSSSGTRLNAVVTDVDSTAVGIETMNDGGVVIYGSAKVDIYAESKSTATTSAYAHGISCGGVAGVYDSASLTVTCLSATTASGASSAAAIYASNVEFNTAGTISLDTHDCVGANYAINSSTQPKFTKAKMIGIMWRRTATQPGGYSYNEPVFDYSVCAYARNIDEQDAIASFRQGTPYKLNVVNGTCNMADGQYLEGDVAVITPKAITGVEFEKWVSDKPLTFMNGTSATDKRVEIAIGAEHLTVTAVYDAFEADPFFDRVSPTEGLISYEPIASNIDPGLMRLIVSGGDPTSEEDIVTTWCTPGKSVYANGVPYGEYQVALSVGGVWHFSQPFIVDYSLNCHYVTVDVPVPAHGAAPADVEAAVPGTADYSVLDLKWYEGGTVGSPGDELGSDDLFQAGSTYICELLLKPAYGVTFASDVLASISASEPLSTFVYHALAGNLLVRAAFEAPAPTPEVYIGGVGLAQGQYLASGSTTPTFTPIGDNYAYYNGGVLTLCNYELAGEGYLYETTRTAAVYAPFSIGLVLKGDNSIIVSDAEDTVGDGIVLGGGLDTAGDGSLVVEAGGFGVYAGDGDISFKGNAAFDFKTGDDAVYSAGDISLFTNSVAVESSGGKGFWAPYGNISILSGAVSATTKAAALYAAGSITMSDGDVYAESTVTAVYAEGDIFINDGAFLAKSTNAANDEAYKAIRYGGVFEVAGGLEVSASTEPDGEPVEYVAADHDSYDLIVVTPAEPTPPAPVTYEIAVSASPVEGGTVSGAGTYEEGESVTVVATPASGYKFVAWTEAGTQVSTSAAYTIEVTTNRSLVALFEEDASEPLPVTYDVTVSASPVEGGTVSGAGTYEDGMFVTLQAVANAGWKFVAWMEGGVQVSTSAAYTIQATADRSFVAIFEVGTSDPIPEPPYSDLWKSFPDVMKEVEKAGGPDKVWYVADGWLDYVVDAGLMSGYSSNGWFGPYDNITRGQVAVILYRSVTSEDGGVIEEKYGSTVDPAEYGKFSYFEDMKANQYYTAAVNWAKDEGIMTGDSSTGYKTVRPNDPISREELCVMLDRYANGSASSGELLAPGVGNDIIGMNKVSSWAKGSVNWCINNGIIYGVDNHDGTYSMNPGDKTWRSAAAKMFTVLMRDVL